MGWSGLFVKIAPAIFMLFSFKTAYCADLTAERIQKSYEGLKDIKGKFVQKSHIKDLKRTDTFNGTFMIKVPSKMRWQYQGDKSDEVIINDDEMIVYQKSEKQAFRSRFDRSAYGRSPIALLSGLGNILQEFEVALKSGKLVLKPRKDMNGIVSIEISPSEVEFPIGSLVITDRRSNRIEISLKDVVINSGIKDAVFDFSLPKGASIYDYSQP